MTTAAAPAATENPAPTTDAPAAPAPAETVEAPRTFTQADIDRIVHDRLAKFADYDAVKAELDTIKAAGLSDLEKAQAAADKAIKEAETARAELAKAHRETVVAQAAKDAHDPAEVARLLDVADDATDDDVKAAVANLLAAKPYLVRGPSKPQPTPGTTATPDNSAGLLSLDQIARLDPAAVAKDPSLYAQVIKSRDHWARQA